MTKSLWMKASAKMAYIILYVIDSGWNWAFFNSIAKVLRTPKLNLQGNNYNILHIRENTLTSFD